MKLIQDINQAVGILQNFCVLAHPADTCYGLAVDLNSKEALKKLQKIKGRDRAKPMSIMLSQSMKSDLEEYVILDDFSRKVCERLFPGPVTIVLPKGPKIPVYFFSELDTVGIRIPDDLFTNDFIEQFGGPVVTTSANLSGQPSCHTDMEVISVFEGRDAKPEAILKGEIPDKKLPSTVLTIKNDEIEILREGPLKKSDIDELLNGF